ncbi:cilia- and flagella-associated protein 418-like isoform X1 [Dermacentor silvarum]|uniref:cilia- and flagella-associated protein 418-like isoform X1 n=1 Tax=Dermacentor silvarum TaxID=543639 RepID=UPI00189A4754|nr:cilia- and flagella-associated protein 418-like isoform X1 [Dermacentor silvarum]XP_049525560.1 cilia- and flagella-associated protein 418-like isoform X1 [Dermacentor silvarum]
MQQFLANSMRMEDDIDALLDDVEAKYCERMCQRASAPTAGTSSDDSIEEAINEICRVPEFNVPNRDLTESKLFGGRNIQCYVVYLGGTDVVFGVSTSASKRACSHIHCCKCDFQVSVFEDFAWDETADYLFFRNSVPDASKLRSRLFRKLGWRAYCCQCHWRSVAALASAQQERLPWMCARH